MSNRRKRPWNQVVSALLNGRTPSRPEVGLNYASLFFATEPDKIFLFQTVKDSAGFCLEPLPVTGIKTTGVVRCDQPRVIDLTARHARKVDTLPEPIMDEVLAKVATLFE